MAKERGKKKVQEFRRAIPMDKESTGKLDKSTISEKTEEKPLSKQEHSQSTDEKESAKKAPVEKIQEDKR